MVRKKKAAGAAGGRRRPGHNGSLLLVLHAHLPYVRHPERESFLEESWLFEAVLESYLPLVEVLGRLADEGVPFTVTVSLSPTLAAMLTDGLLMDRLRGRVEGLLSLAEREVKRTRADASFGPVARMYRKRLARLRRLFEEDLGGDIPGALGALAGAGAVELITTSATHAYLPGLAPFPSAVLSQMALGMESHRRLFGRRPPGLWLPECGYFEGLDSVVSSLGAGYFFLESHGLLHGRPRPSRGVFRPARTPAGAAAFARDPEASRLVWSAETGYPGGPWYREFHRDIGYDLPPGHIGIHPGGMKAPTGLKYHRVSGRGRRKEPYVRAKALARARADAAHFASFLGRKALDIKEAYGFSPLFVAPFDCELFGHWWFEGPEWLGAVLAELPARGVRAVGPSEYLAEVKGLQEVEPSASSWGWGGFGGTWANPANDRWLAEVLRACAGMDELASSLPRRPRGPVRRAAGQALRELLLAQASDWPFMLNTGASSAYAESRLREHMGAFWRLRDMALAGEVDEGCLDELWRRRPFLPEAEGFPYGRSLAKGYVLR
ncbi:MAG: DUF1957 domain-containing protein [Thermodesulfovibrionales bacterium]